MEKINDTKHSILGASSAIRWVPCSGSTNLIQAAGIKAPGSEDAAKGTVAHKIASDFFLEGIPLEDQLDKTYQVDQYAITVDQKMIDSVTVYINDIYSDVKKWHVENEHIFIEHRVPLHGTDWDGLPREGTVDCALLVPYQRLIVKDYKNGFKPVNVEGNLQALDYVLGFLKTLPPGIVAEIPIIQINIIQPNGLGEWIKVWEIPQSRVWEHAAFLDLHIDKAMDPKAPLAAGSWCDDSFCPARTYCPELVNRAHVVAGQKFTNVKIDTAILPQPEQMTDESLVFLLDNADLLKTLIKAAEEEALARKLRGIEITGYEIAESFGHRKFTEPSLFVDELIKRGVDEDTFAPRKMLTVAQMETVLMKSGLTKRKAQEMLDLFSNKPSLGYKLKKTNIPLTSKFDGVKIDKPILKLVGK